MGRLVEEGNLDPEEREAALRSLEAPETLAVLGHLGAHIAISVPLRFPFGSVTRFGYVVFFRLRSEGRALIRRDPDEQLRGARKIHTLTVALASLVKVLVMLCTVIGASPPTGTSRKRYR